MRARIELLLRQHKLTKNDVKDILQVETLFFFFVDMKHYSISCSILVLVWSILLVLGKTNLVLKRFP